MAIATAALVLTAIAGIASAKASSDAGKVQEKTLKKQAKDAETQARERALQRKKKLNRVLAAQIAGMGASGVAGEGSPTTIAVNNIKEADLGDMAGTANASAVQSDLKAAGKNARKLGNLKAATTLISTGANVGISGSQLGVF